ncbi:MAG TPA: hypothetical protein VLZ07_12545 [Syntrophales bacterium]|nr:hypothetical protein [Syntrophales bacterium]
MVWDALDRSDEANYRLYMEERHRYFEMVFGEPFTADALEKVVKNMNESGMFVREHRRMSILQMRLWMEKKERQGNLVYREFLHQPDAGRSVSVL